MRQSQSAECRRRELLPSTKNDRRQHRYNIRIQLRAPRRISGASVGGLVNPTPLVSGARKDLLDRQLAFCAGAQWVRFATLGGHSKTNKVQNKHKQIERLELRYLKQY